MLERDAAVEDDDLLERLRALGTQVQELAPACVGLSLAVREEDLAVTLVATDVEMALLDAMQYVADGPCVEALGSEEVLEVNEERLLDEDEWRVFALASAAASVASTLTLPVVVDDAVVGTVNLYAAAPHAFSGLHEEIAALFGAWAPGAVANADLSFSTRRAAEEAPGRLRDRARFDTAVGLVAAREGLSLEDAQSRLVSAAERGGVSLPRVVQAVISYYSG